VLALSACGGGSGAPNNTFQRPLEVLPTSADVYAGFPTLLFITRGTGPFQVISSNPTVLPVTQNIAGPNVLLLANSVVGTTPVTITIEDLAPSAAASPALTRATVAVTVHEAPLLNSLTIADLADCDAALCSGETALATSS
jgi:hypothetical protein